MLHERCTAEHIALALHYVSVRPNHNFFGSAEPNRTEPKRPNPNRTEPKIYNMNQIRTENKVDTLKYRRFKFYKVFGC